VAENPLIVGRISGLFGVKGWLRIFSHTAPRENILRYRQWWVTTPTGGWQSYQLAEGQAHGAGVVAKLAGIDDRDLAATLLQRDIAVDRSALAPLAAGDYYWADLIGLAVVNRQGELLGKIGEMLDTPANDVMVVIDSDGSERLIPYAIGRVVDEVDLAAGEIRVDWQRDY
jgi:16S rRNA processing protein RimM